MDHLVLIQLFDATFNPDAAIRKSAEQELRKNEGHEGLLSAVLQIISSEQCSIGTRQAAAVFFKNRTTKAWTSSESRTPTAPIPESDRAYIKQHIMSILCNVPSVLKSQVKVAMGAVIVCDFPEQWPELLPTVMSGLTSGKENEVEGALLALTEMFKAYRFQLSGREVPNQLAEKMLPLLVQLGSGLLAQVPQPAAPAATGRTLHLIFKIYRATIQTEMTPHHQAQQSIVPWGTLFLQVVNRSLSPADVPEDTEEREKCSWWKAKKWAYFCLNRLFSKYGSPSQLASNMTEYKAFAAHFEQHFAPEIFKAYLKQVELYIGAQAWLSRRCVKLTIDFLDECIKPKSTWALLKNHLNQIIEHFLFPFLCPDDEEVAEFEDDPVEYIRLYVSDFRADYYQRPEISALNFMDSLATSRKKTALQPLLGFATGIVAEYPEKRTTREKEGALKLISNLASPILKSKQFGASMEDFFLHYVVPEFKSSNGMLRVRACQMVATFEGLDMTWKDESNIDKLFNLVSQSMLDPALPVRVSAALALPELARYDRIRQLVAPNIGQIMTEMLKLGNEVDIDALVDTSRKLVEDFSEELIPFAVDLTASWSASYLRIMQEQLEARSSAPDEDSVLEEKTLAAMGLLKTLSQLIAAISEKPEVLRAAENAMLPALEFTLQHQFTEMYDDIFDLVDSLTFHQKAIGPSMWRVFELIYATFKSEGLDFLDEMLTSLDNFISYGGDVIASNAQYLGMILDIFETTMQSLNLGAVDRVAACKLAESVLLNMRGKVDSAVPVIMQRALSVITRTDTEVEPIITSSLYLHSLELVVNTLFYNSTLALSLLDSQGQTAAFFQKWFAKIGQFKRVHDRKLGIMAIASLLQTIPSSSSDMGSEAVHLLQGALGLFKDLPKAAAARAELEKEYNGDDDSDFEDELAENAGGVEEDELDQTEDDADVENDEDAAYMEFLQSKIAEKIAGNKARLDVEGSDDGLSEATDDWEEEVLFTSPLDDLDVYQEFSQMLQQLEASHPQFAQHLLSSLDESSRNAVLQINQVAQAGGEKGLTLQAAA